MIKLLLSRLGLTNKNKIIYEFIGSSGSGKSTIIRNVNIISKENNINKSLITTKINFGLFLLINPFIFIYVLFYFIKIKKNFLHFTHPNFRKRTIKLFVLVLRFWYILKNNSSSFILLESLLHQVKNLELDLDIFLENILRIYGYPKICVVFVSVPPDISIKRMYERGDDFNLHDPIIQERYELSFDKCNQIYNYLLLNNKKLKNFLKPIYLDGRKSSTINAKIFYKKIKKFKNKIS